MRAHRAADWISDAPVIVASVASTRGRDVAVQPLGPAQSQAQAHQRSIRARRHRCSPHGYILLRRLSLHLHGVTLIPLSAKDTQIPSLNARWFATISGNGT